MSKRSEAVMGDEIGRLVPTLTQRRSQARDRMLNGLSSDHLLLLSQLVGQLVVAMSPDVGAAARELDNALTPDEKQCIAHASADLNSQANRAIESLKRGLMRSGENVVFGTDDSLRITHENPAMTLLALSIEQLISGVNKEKYGRPPK
jgi:hypothetical protein